MATTTPDPADLARLGAALKRTRERRGLALKACAERIGMTHVGLKHIEAGRAGLSTAMLFRLARALECSWNDILGPPPSHSGDEPDWQAGYRAGVGDAVMATRKLLEAGDRTEDEGMSTVGTWTP